MFDGNNLAEKNKNKLLNSFLGISDTYKRTYLLECGFELPSTLQGNKTISILSGENKHLKWTIFQLI